MQQINKITPPFPETMALSYFRERWECPGMLDQTKQLLYTLTKASMDI